MFIDYQALMFEVIEFLVYFLSGSAILAGFMWVYTLITPYRDFDLIKQNNVAVATVWSGALLGYLLPVAAALQKSESLLEFVIWALIASGVQVLAFLCVRQLHTRILDRIQRGEMAASFQLAMISFAAGVLNAVSVV